MKQPGQFLLCENLNALLNVNQTTVKDCSPAQRDISVRRESLSRKQFKQKPKKMLIKEYSNRNIATDFRGKSQEIHTVMYGQLLFSTPDS